MKLGDLKVVFAGNPEIAVGALEALASVCDVVAVITNPDKPTGRGRHLESPPVKIAAAKLSIPVLQYDRLLKEARDEIRRLAPDVLVSFACGFYFGPKFLSLFPVASVNIHPSLLPCYRGCSPIQYTILNGEKSTGITIQRIAAELDAGNILAVEQWDLKGHETTQSLSEEVARRAGPLLVSVLDHIISGTVVEQIQSDDLATYAPMLSKDDAYIDWNSSVEAIHCKVRALNPWPRAVTTFEGRQLSITSVWGTLDQTKNEPLASPYEPGTVIGLVKNKGLSVACSDGLIYIDRMQLAMKREMDSESFVHGHPSIIGAILGH